MHRKSTIVLLLGIALAGFMILVASRQTSLQPPMNASSQTRTTQKLLTVLTVAEKNRVVAPQGEKLILLLDLQPNRGALPAEELQAGLLIGATARFYAKQYLATPEFGKINIAEAHIVYVENMDEYNRANYAGMVRLGTLKFARDGEQIKLIENNVKFIP